MKKNKVTINETDLKYIVSESVKRIITEFRDSSGYMWERGGRIPRDGMTGGAWGSETRKGKYRIDIYELSQNLSEKSYIPGIQEVLEELEDNLYFIVTANYGFDDTVGLSEGYSDVEVDINPAYQAIMSCPALSKYQKKEIEDIFNNLANNIENQDREIENVEFSE